MMPATHYQHSGKAPLGGILLTLVAGAIAGAILGIVYGYLIFWIPFIYINVFVTLGFGIALGAITGAMAAKGKIRNSGAVMVVALIVALFAYYVHWVVWVERIIEVRIIDPAILWTLLSEVARQGAWSIFGWTPTGFAMWAIWGIEAAMILGLGSIGAAAVIDVPFCEDSNQWAEESTLAMRFKTVANATESPSAVLSALEALDETAAAYTEVKIATVEGSELRCVSLENVSVDVDKDGKESTSRSNMVKNMLFDRDSFERLLSLAHAG